MCPTMLLSERLGPTSSGWIVDEEGLKIECSNRTKTVPLSSFYLSVVSENTRIRKKLEMQQFVVVVILFEQCDGHVVFPFCEQCTSNG